jgi:hypothetical protein
MEYSQLDASMIVSNLEVLSQRIYERFPESGLHKVSQQLLTFCRAAQEDSAWVSQPILPLRIGTLVLVLIFSTGLIWTIFRVGMPEETLGLMELVPLLESAINDVIYIAAGIVFLITLENRIKRNRTLKSVHRLRAFAHIIDMHQLHKDPERVLQRGELTPSTPRIDMTSFELSRYLDYCSEMLSLTGKTAGLYAQSSNDPVVIDAVSEIENLTSGISRKIWQKLLILHTLDI